MDPQPHPLLQPESQPLSQPLSQPPPNFSLPNNLVSMPPLRPQGLSHPMSQVDSQPQAGSAEQPHGASQPQAGSAQPLSHPLALLNILFSRPLTRCPSSLGKQLLLQPLSHPPSQPIMGAEHPQGASTPQAGSLEQPQGASTPQAGSDVQPQGASAPQAGSDEQPQGASAPHAGSQPESQQEAEFPQPLRPSILSSKSNPKPWLQTELATTIVKVKIVFFIGATSPFSRFSRVQFASLLGCQSRLIKMSLGGRVLNRSQAVEDSIR